MVQIVASVDSWGIDPLTVGMFDDADSSKYTVKTIDASLEANPQIVSYDAYGSTVFWALILIANSLIHPSEMTAGTKLKLPIREPKTTVKKIQRTSI